MDNCNKMCMLRTNIFTLGYFSSDFSYETGFKRCFKSIVDNKSILCKDTFVEIDQF